MMDAHIVHEMPRMLCNPEDGVPITIDALHAERHALELR